MGGMRIILVAALMVVGCADGQDTIDVETACYEQAEARCEWLDGCINGPGDTAECVAFFSGWCEDRHREPIATEEHEACLESLETAGCGFVYPFTQQCDGDH